MKSANSYCIAAGLCVAALTIGPAIADTWSGAYDATIVSTYSDGRVVKVYVNPDHSYSITLPDGKTLSGTWKDADGQSCFTLSNPPPDAKPSCFPLKDYKVGDTFSGKDSSGSFTGLIKAGR